jgi:hypothetical protein
VSENDDVTDEVTVTSVRRKGFHSSRHEKILRKSGSHR